MRKRSIIRRLTLVVVIMATGFSMHGQSAPSPVVECGEYQWPPEVSPCPEVQIKQKHDHMSLARYRQRGWDTVVTCAERELVLSCMPYIPVRKFNGTYYVDQITYNPPDPTFSMGSQLPNSADDKFCASPVSIPYPFYFFGIQKSSFVAGGNGIITFNASAAGNNCSYADHSPIPWGANGSNWAGYSGATATHHMDAIYGVFQDTDPSGDVTAPQGIHYGIQDGYPCRKIVCSYLGLPLYPHGSYHSDNDRCTYQIVCYEGSNIIEVHIQNRGINTSWKNANGIVGIQNATGVAQVRSTDPMAPNSSVEITGKPAAFYPSGYNITRSPIHEVAFRFTPAGTNQPNYGWLRILNDSVSVELSRLTSSNPEAVNDTNGYYTPMDESSSCPTLTKAFVKPTRSTRYVFYMKFKNANDDWYNLYDTIFVGMDTANYLDIHKLQIKDTQPSELDICLGDTGQMRIDMTSLQVITHQEWQISRISGGDTILLDTLIGDGSTNLSTDYLNIGNYETIGAFRITPQGDTIVLDTTLFRRDDYPTIGDSIIVRRLSLFSNQLPTSGLRANKIDSIFIQVSSDFASGCHNFDTMLVKVFPNFDTILNPVICRGESYTWDTNGRAYRSFTENTDPSTAFVHLHSAPGCDSTVRLNLQVKPDDFYIDVVEDCKPIVWKNGKKYTQSNAATAATDTIILKNRYDCDSVVQLQLLIHPLQAKLRSDIDYFTLDNLNVELTDISTGGSSRVWKFPNGGDHSSPVAYYSIPAELDGANIILIEHSPYGCVDTATIYIPLNKEHFWVPNAFTPDNPAGNNLFASVSTKTLRQEMFIYNRRGEMVYSCEGVDCAWDGRDFDGNPCIQGAYVYLIRYTNEFEPRETHVVKGTVTLIR